MKQFKIRRLVWILPVPAPFELTDAFDSSEDGCRFRQARKYQNEGVHADIYTPSW